MEQITKQFNTRHDFLRFPSTKGWSCGIKFKRFWVTNLRIGHRGSATGDNIFVLRKVLFVNC